MSKLTKLEQLEKNVADTKAAAYDTYADASAAADAAYDACYRARIELSNYKKELADAKEV